MPKFLTDEQMNELEKKPSPPKFISDEEMAERESFDSKYLKPAASSIQEGAKWALGRVGEGVQFIDKYGGPGALRTVIGGLQEGKGLGESLTQPYDYEKAPSWKDIYGKAGMSTEATIKSPLVMNPFDPEANKLSPAGIAGGITGGIADPLNLIGLGTAGKVAKGVGEGVEMAAKQGGKAAGRFAEERAAKAVLGNDVAAYRGVTGTPTVGGTNPQAVMQDIRSFGRTHLDDRNIGWASKSEDIGKKIGEKLPKVGEVLGEHAKIVDVFQPSGAVSGERIAQDILDYAARIPETEGGAALQDRLLREAARIQAKGNYTVDDAIRLKNAFAYKPTQADLLISNQDASNALYGIVNSNIEDAVENTAKMLDTINAPEAKEAAARLREYGPMKDKYGQYKEGAKAATKAEIREQKNRIISPSDYGSSIAMGLGGGIVGGDVKSAAMGATLGLGHKIVRERGAAFSARAADEISKMLSSNAERFGKWGSALSKASAAGNSALVTQHHLLMENDQDYRKAVLAEITANPSEPYATIGKMMDASGIGALGAGVAVPMMLFKKGSLLSAAKEMIKLNTGTEEIGAVRKEFISAAKKSHPDRDDATLGAMFDSAVNALGVGKPKKASFSIDDITPEEDAIIKRNVERANKTLKESNETWSDVIPFRKEGNSPDSGLNPNRDKALTKDSVDQGFEYWDKANKKTPPVWQLRTKKVEEIYKILLDHGEKHAKSKAYMIKSNDVMEKARSLLDDVKSKSKYTQSPFSEDAVPIPGKEKEFELAKKEYDELSRLHEEAFERGE